MKIYEMQQKIERLKRERGACVLAHSYMSRAICEVADFVGDSFALAKYAAESEAKVLIMCGVRFMAETCKMLSPEKRVYMPNPDATCPMAEQFAPKDVLALKERYPEAAVVAYVNTTTALKAVSDVCVTSSSAVKICRALPQSEIIFIPDINLGSYVRDNVPEKRIYLMQGGCPRHAAITEEEVLSAKHAHPAAQLLVHPECRPEVVKYADYIGSTSGICDYAKASEAREFIIGTENAICEQLQFECPKKMFYPLSKRLICPDMKAVTLVDLYNCLKGEGGEEINLPQEMMQAAVRAIRKMIEYGG